MPLYDYHCSRCGHDFEGVSRIEERYFMSCPKCKKEDVSIQIRTFRQPIKFPEGFWHGLAGSPYITSMGQLREEVKKASTDRFTECSSAYDDGYRRG